MHIQDSRLLYFVFSFLTVLALRYSSSSYFVSSTETIAGLCQTKDQPNPIASTYPNNATGTLNGTTSIIPISLEVARKLIPPQYQILEHAYRELLPSFPLGMYPAIFEALHDHGVQAFGFQIPDFSRAGIQFPFIDLLGDNTTSFKWAPSLLMTYDNVIAIKGSMDYGTNTYPSNFDPACDAYSAVPMAKNPGTTSFHAESVDGATASVSTMLSTTMDSPFPLSFYKNVTNQPTFADGKSCDNMIRLFNTSVTTAPNNIETVKGTVKAKMAPFNEEQEWVDVYGIRLDTAFIENNYLPCENFRGYGGSD